MVFKFSPKNQAPLILTGLSTSSLLYRTVKSTTLLFLKIFNAPLTSAFNNLTSSVLYNPRCTRFPLKPLDCGMSALLDGIKRAVPIGRLRNYFLLVPFFLSVLRLRSHIRSSLVCLKRDIISSKVISDGGIVFFGSQTTGLLL